MRKTRRRKEKEAPYDIIKNKEDDEYLDLNKKSKSSIDNELLILRYKKIIRIMSFIIVCLVLCIIGLIFIKTSNINKPINIIKNKNLLNTKQNIDTNIQSNITENKDNNITNENKGDNENEVNNEEKGLILDNKNDLLSTIVKNTTLEKRKIYVKYMDFWPAFELSRFDVHKILIEKYDVILSEKPDYVIFGEFGGENYGIENKFDCIKLFLTIENRGPNFENTDYAIGIHYIENGDRYFRKPTETHQLTAIHSVYNVTQVKGIDIKKKKFCAWVVSNGSASARNLFYDKLSQYKVVDSGGSFRNNVGGPVDDKLEFLKDYKFSICFENSKTDGYISEKLSDAFEAGTIPIYYGDDTILELLNNRSYIHVKDESEFDEKIELIKKIDQNDTLYEEMIREKIVIDDTRYPREVQKYKDFIYHIIDQDKEKAKRFERKKT